MNIEIVRCIRGVMAVHRHYLPDGRMWWAGFVKHGQYEGVWEQYHLKAYEKWCVHCHKLYPRNEVLEAAFREAVEKAGGQVAGASSAGEARPALEGLPWMDTKTGEVKP